jgi:hypothetical protein
MASSSSSSSIKRSIDNIETSKENVPCNKRRNLAHTPFQLKIIDLFKDVNLIAPTQLLGRGFAIEQTENNRIHFLDMYAHGKKIFPSHYK